MKITDGGLDDPRVQTLLAHHFQTARAETAPGSAHALDLSGLKAPDIHFWSASEGDRVIAVGAESGGAFLEAVSEVPTS